MLQSDALPAAAQFFSRQAVEISPQRLARIFGNTAIDSRNTCQPLDWYLQPHDFAERNGLYLQHAEELLQQAADAALDDAGLQAECDDGRALAPRRETRPQLVEEGPSPVAMASRRDRHPRPLERQRVEGLEVLRAAGQPRGDAGVPISGPTRWS